MLVRANNRYEKVIPPGADVTVAGFPGVGLSWNLCFKDGKPQKKTTTTKTKKRGGAREVKLGSPLQNTQIKKKKKSFANKTTKHRWGAASTERTWLPVVMLETEAQQQDTSCCSHSFASFRGFREYPSVEDGKGKIKTPIRVAVAERRRRETVKRTPCVGALPLASCCLREPTELWETERLWSPGK